MTVTYSTHAIAQGSIFVSARNVTLTMDVTGTDYLVGYSMTTYADLNELYYATSVGATTFTKVSVAGKLTAATLNPAGLTTGIVTITSSANNGTLGALLCIVKFNGVRTADPYSQVSTIEDFSHPSTVTLNLLTTNTGMISYGWYLADDDHTTGISVHAPAASITTRVNMQTDNTRIFQLHTHAAAASTFGSSHTISSGTDFYRWGATISLNPASVISAAIAQTIFLVG